jgi:hypothetical protein
VFLTGCGGEVGTKNKTRVNEYLGPIPAMLADFELAAEARKENIEKLRANGNRNEAKEELEKLKEEWNKFQETVLAEAAKIVGTAIPFSSSNAFTEKYFFEVVSATLDENGDVAVSLVAKEDFTLQPGRSGNYDEYKTCYYRVFAKDNSTIDKNKFVPVKLSGGKSKSFIKGEPVQDKNIIIELSYERPEKWIDFSGIEFITCDEYMVLLQSN